MQAIYSKLTKLSDNQNALRSSVIDGFFYVAPYERQSAFLFFAQPFEKSKTEHKIRIINTSPVINVEKDLSRIVFVTENSTYELQIAPLVSQIDVDLERTAQDYQTFLSAIYAKSRNSYGQILS